jgi:hypothetical protein
MNPEMIGMPQIRGWKALALLATVFTLLLGSLAHPADHHSALFFLLAPLVLIIQLVDALVLYGPAPNNIFPPIQHIRSALFQRPPPPLV